MNSETKSVSIHEALCLLQIEINGKGRTIASVQDLDEVIIVLRDR